MLRSAGIREILGEGEGDEEGEGGSRGVGETAEKKRRKAERGIRGESQAPPSWVQPVVMVTAVRQDGMQTGRFAPL